MREPDHKVKRHIVPLSNKQKPYWIENPVHGWLGSGIKDKNGVEIFEGDIVKFEGGVCGIVRFDNAQFYVDISEQETPFTLNRLCTPFVEVVGHIATEEKT